MNRFRKYCPNVWIAECDEEYEKGDIVILETKYGKEVECEIHNFLGNTKKDTEIKWLYSTVRLEDKSYAERKAEKYNNAAFKNRQKSDEKWKQGDEAREFLSLGEPIKVGHHSEKRHRALLKRNWDRCEKAVELSNKAEEQKSKAEYWEKKAKEITLAMPESLDYFKHRLEEAEKYHKFLKENPKERSHSYSLTYAKKEVNELNKKVQIAEKLWGNNEYLPEVN